MKLDTDKIIGAGLVLALLIKIGGDIAVALLTGSAPSSELATTIVGGLVGYMGRDLAAKLRKDNQHDNHQPISAKRTGTAADKTDSPTV